MNVETPITEPLPITWSDLRERILFVMSFTAIFTGSVAALSGLGMLYAMGFDEMSHEFSVYVRLFSPVLFFSFVLGIPLGLISAFVAYVSALFSPNRPFSFLPDHRGLRAALILWAFNVC